MAVATSSLNTIQQKVRRLTRSPSESQLTTDDLNQYINTFVLYDFPESVRLFNLLTTFEFFTEPYKDTYTFSTNPLDPLYDFENRFITVNPPIYIAGWQAEFYEDRTKFFGLYPLLESIASIGTAGNGSTVKFTGVINTNQAIIPPFLQGNTQGTILLANNVLFSSIANDNSGLSMIDWPLNGVPSLPAVPGFGNLYVPGGAPTSTNSIDPNNNINYLTGEFTVTFVSAPQAGIAINSQTLPLQPSIPRSMLFYDGAFTLRPVPDQPYRVQMEVFQRPTELLAGSQNPNLNEWFQYISYGAAIKIFQDRMDLDSVNLIMPEFKHQESLILRRTIVQQTSQRTATIYTDNYGNSSAYGPGLFNNSSGSF